MKDTKSVAPHDIISSMNELVSVVIPSYNAARYIAEAIESILAQTYKNNEIVLVDDGSTDNTRELVNTYVEKYPGRIRYIFQENGGCAAARNTGILASRGKYVAFLDADDIWLEDFLDKMVKKIKEGFDWVVCDLFREFVNLETLHRERTLIRLKLDERWTVRELLKASLIRSRTNASVMVKRRVLLEKDILFDDQIKFGEDGDFCIQLLSHGCSLGWVKEPLFVYRIRSDNSNSTRYMRPSS